jgi:hypothetical protein
LDLPPNLRGRLVGSEPNDYNASVSFDRVQLIEETPPKDWAFKILLLTVSQKGDVTVFLLMPGAVDTVGRNKHSQPVVFAGLDEKHEWLMSSSADGVLRISGFTGREGEAIGNVLHLGRAAASARRVGDRGIAVSFDEGEPRSFLLRSVLKAPLGESPTVIEPKAQCKRWDGPDHDVYASGAAENGKLLTDKGELSRLGTRQVAVIDQGVKLFASPIFTNDVILTCLSDGGDSMSVTTSDFVTEIGRPIFPGGLVRQSTSGACFGKAKHRKPRGKSLFRKTTKAY